MPGLSRFTRRTISRPSGCSLRRLEVNAVNGVSATSASEISRCSSSSQIAFGYWIGVHAESVMVEIARTTAGVIRVVTETFAPPRAAAATTSWL